MSPPALNLDSFMWGVLLGVAIMTFVCMGIAHRHSKIWLDNARQKRADKMSDGKFYYLVEEKDYVKNNLFKRREPIGWITTDALGRLRKKDAASPEHLFPTPGGQRSANKRVAVFEGD